MAGIGDKKQIVLEKWSYAKVSGRNTESVTRFRVWADVEFKSGTRSSLNNQVDLVRTVRFGIRLRPGMNINGTWKIVYDGKTYTIEVIEKDQERRFYWVFKAVC